MNQKTTKNKQTHEPVEKCRICIWIDPVIYEAIRTKAVNSGRSITQEITKALRSWNEQMRL